MMRHRGQPRRFRPLFTLVLLAMVAAAIMYLRCGDEFGLGGSTGGSVGDGKQGEAERDRGDQPGDGKSDIRPAAGSGAAAKQRLRCELRLDASGLTLDGEPATPKEAADECKKVGAELTVTGDAKFGESEKVRKALDEAGVEVFVREGAAPGR
jgi:hypothetical protein